MGNAKSTRKGLKAALRSWLIGPTSSFSGVLSNNLNYGVAVNHDAALRYTAVYAAIKILSENIAALPKSVSKKTDGGYEEAAKHPVHRILSIQPNDYTDIFTFWFTIISWLEGKGNAFAIIKFDERNRPVELHQVDPSYVDVQFIRGNKVYTVKYTDPDFEFLNGTYQDWEMLHFMLFTKNGITGIDPISYNAAAIGEGIAAQKFGADFFRNGGQIKGTLETDQALGDDEYEQFMKHYSAASGNFQTPLLEYGIKYKNIAISPEASQLLQTRTFSIDDIARMFSIPPHLLAEMSHATFSNIEQQNIFFGSYSLRPICKRLEQQMERKLFTEKERGDYHIKFDLKGMMRGDDAARANYYAQGINCGWMTPNEAREYEGLKRLPGLDEPRIPMNYTTVGDADQKDKDNETV